MRVYKELPKAFANLPGKLNELIHVDHLPNVLVRAKKVMKDPRGLIKSPNRHGCKSEKKCHIDSAKIRKLLALWMESPFYFTMPLQTRLEFIKFFSQKSVYHLIRF